MYMYHFLYSSDYWELCLASHHLTTTVNTLWVLSHYSNNWAAVLYVFLCRMDGRRDWLTCSLWLILSQEPVSHDTLTPCLTVMLSTIYYNCIYVDVMCIWSECVWLTGLVCECKINHKLHVWWSLVPSILHKNTYNTAAQLLCVCECTHSVLCRCKMWEARHSSVVWWVQEVIHVHV